MAQSPMAQKSGQPQITFTSLSFISLHTPSILCLYSYLTNYLVKRENGQSFIYSVKLCQPPDFYFQSHLRKLAHPKLENSSKNLQKWSPVSFQSYIPETGKIDSSLRNTLTRNLPFCLVSIFTDFQLTSSNSFLFWTDLPRYNQICIISIPFPQNSSWLV